MRPEDLTPEQQEQARSCTSPQDLLAFARSEGIELDERQLEQISGGSWGSGPACPNCGSDNVMDVPVNLSTGELYFECRSCGHTWR